MQRDLGEAFTSDSEGLFIICTLDSKNSHNIVPPTAQSGVGAPLTPPISAQPTSTTRNVGLTESKTHRTGREATRECTSIIAANYSAH